MAWTLTGDLNDFLAAAGGFLRSDPVQHTIELTAAETLLARGMAAFGSPGALFGWWRPGTGPVTATLFHTPPYPALLTPLPVGAAPPLARALLARGHDPLGVTAEQRDAGRFAAAWTDLTGARARVVRRSRLFRLGMLTPLGRPAGAARVATAADRGLLSAWLTDFSVETGDSPGPPPGTVDDELSYGGLTLWEAGGIPVAVAGARRPAAGVVRVGPVYTPPDQRRHGYAAAATAAVSQAALDAGAAGVVLFTDLASKASNALYPRLGYQPVADRAMLSFRS
jgi:RimJ/RimL family protein N-acetyltransferase